MLPCSLFKKEMSQVKLYQFLIDNQGFGKFSICCKWLQDTVTGYK